MSIYFLIFLFISCYSVSRNCKEFHEGEFLFKSIINGEIKTSKFIRKKNIEIEIFENKTDTAKIKWVNECECVLTKLNPVSNQEKRPIQIKIISQKMILFLNIFIEILKILEEENYQD